MLDVGGDAWRSHARGAGGLVVRARCVASGGFLGRAAVALIVGARRVRRTLW